MHKTLFAILLLSGCSMMAGAKSVGTPSSSGGGSVADKYEGAKELPVSLKNMKRLGEKLDKQIAEIEEGVANGTMQSPRRDLVSTRTSLISYYGYGHKGGSEECEACKNHPEFAGLVENYTALDKRQRALEEKYLKCNYGYKMSNGDILRPTYEWSREEWDKIREKSTHKTSRCWMIANPDEYN